MNTRNLFSAVKKGPFSSFASQMEASGNVNCRDTNDNTLLLMALRKQRYAVATYLLDKGAEVNLCNCRGVSPLLAAAYAADTHMVGRLLAAGAGVQVADNRGFAPLHAAAVTGRVEILELLLQHGADIHAEDMHGNTAAMQALMHGRTPAVQFLQSRGAILPAQRVQAVLELVASGRLRTRVCKSPFEYAVLKKDVALVQALVHLGMNLTPDSALRLMKLALSRLDAPMVQLMYTYADREAAEQVLAERAEKCTDRNHVARLEILAGLGVLEHLPYERYRALLYSALQKGNLRRFRLIYEGRTCRETPEQLLNTAFQYDARNIISYLLRQPAVDDGYDMPLFTRVFLQTDRTGRGNALNWALRRLRTQPHHVVSLVSQVMNEVEPDELASYVELALRSRGGMGAMELLRLLLPAHLGAEYRRPLIFVALECRMYDVAELLIRSSDCSAFLPELYQAAIKWHAIDICRYIQDKLNLAAEIRQQILDSALIEAAHDGNEVEVKLLLKQGADVNAADSKDRTPFNQALKRGIFYECINVCCRGEWAREVRRFRSILELLLARGATLHGIEKHAALPAPRMQKMMRELNLLSRPYEQLITDMTLARRIFPLLPQTLTWI